MADEEPFVDEQKIQFGRWIEEFQSNMRPRPSDRQLARNIGISPTHLGDIKRGETGAKKSTVVKIAIGMGADINDALEHAGMKAHVTIPIDRELSRIASKVPPEKRPAFMRAVRSIAEMTTA